MATIKILAVLLFAISSEAASDAIAQESNPSPELTQAMDQIADRVMKNLKRMKRSKHILVGDFTGMANLRSSGGAEMRRQLQSSLLSLGAEFSEEGEYTQIMGRYKLVKSRLHQDNSFDSLGLDVTLEFFDEFGSELEIFELKAGAGKSSWVNEIGVPLFGSQPLLLAGVTYNVPPNVSEHERQRRIIRQYQRPPTHIEKGNQVRANGNFGIEILVNANDKLTSRKPKLQNNGKAFVPLHDGEEYVVRIHNDENYDIAVNLFVDGISMFVDAKDVKPTEMILVRAGKSSTIRGWYIHDGQKEIKNSEGKKLAATKAFLIGGYEESVANRVGSSANVGTISIEVRAAWSPTGDPPSDEPIADAKGVATTQGREINQKYVSVPRKISKHVRAVLNVRYSR